ncbi:MAG TPA: signal recognition particle-docking protein FtsY [Ktedonobacterales bacterium]|nr:signal recognition particle-docking protein FtsY [Ktedonobacterales bacterium]
MFNRIRERIAHRKSAEEQEAQQKPGAAPQQETPPPAEAARPAQIAASVATPPPAARPPVSPPVAPPTARTPAASVPPPVTPSAPPAAAQPTPTPVEKSAPAPAAKPTPSPVPPPAARMPVPTPQPVPAAAASAEEEWEEEELEEEEERGGRRFHNPFSQSLSRTRQMFGKVSEAFQRGQIDDQLWDDLEETLITSDVGVAITERLIETLKERVEYAGLKDARDVRDALEEELLILLGDPEPLNFSTSGPLTVILVVGVNGVGKTTTIAKLTQYLKKQGHRVILAAGDTFRAAAIDQIKIWGERVKVPVISHQHGADPGAVVFDALEAAENRKCDVLIIDTAGRLHTKYNLMEELKKIAKVLGKKDSEAPHEVLLVVDATTGQNALLQAKQFVGDVGLTGLVLTKLDGTARGGIVFSISEELGLPIKFIGTGERVGDLAPFDPDAFVEALFAADGGPA